MDSTGERELQSSRPSAVDSSPRAEEALDSSPRAEEPAAAPIPTDPPLGQGESQEISSALHDLVGVVQKLLDRVADIEDSVAFTAQETKRVRREVQSLSKVVARRKQLKKLKEVLDRIEVIEEDEEPLADPTVDNVIRSEE